MARAVKKAAKRLAAPTRVFAQKVKKPEPDDMPGRMRGGSQKRGAAGGQKAKRLKGIML